jgi:alpha-D-ribose 1-methylphosphonate 5-triphosphate synthase subunit PhnH
MVQAAVLASGFAEPVFEAQAAFRAAMSALSCPGTVVPLTVDLQPPAPLTSAAAALCLALLDFEVSFYLAPSLAAGDVGAFLRFHTGAREVMDPSDADFAVIDLAHDALDPARFKLGDPAYPDRSTTIIALVAAITPGQGLTLSGPGIQSVTRVEITPLPDAFRADWQRNHQRYPLGVDLVFAAPEAIVGLPRSTRIGEGVA